MDENREIYIIKNYFKRLFGGTLKYFIYKIFNHRLE